MPPIFIEVYKDYIQYFLYEKKIISGIERYFVNGYEICKKHWNILGRGLLTT